MFDTLTTIELNRLIGQLTEDRTATHLKMIDPATSTARISPLSDEWRILTAHYDEIARTVEAAYAELIRREEEARTDA